MADQRKLEPFKYQGKEIFEITPVKLGGSPTDLSNKIILSREQHIEAVNYWNKLIRELQAGKPAGG